jgi:hypothetical protein
MAVLQIYSGCQASRIRALPWHAHDTVHPRHAMACYSQLTCNADVHTSSVAAVRPVPTVLQ